MLECKSQASCTARRLVDQMRTNEQNQNQPTIANHEQQQQQPLQITPHLGQVSQVNHHQLTGQVCHQVREHLLVAGKRINQTPNLTRCPTDYLSAEDDEDDDYQVDDEKENEETGEAKVAGVELLRTKEKSRMLEEENCLDDDDDDDASTGK